MVLLPDSNHHSAIREDLAVGMQELAFLVRLLLLPWLYDEQTCAQTRRHVAKASRHFSEAEQKLEARLLLVDSQLEALLTMKKFIQDDLQEKKGDLADLRTQIAALWEAHRKSQEMLEAAEAHLAGTKEQLHFAHEEVAKNRAGWEIGTRMMILPGLGSLIGASLVVGYQAALDAAENLVSEAQQAVDQNLVEIAGHKDELARLSRKEEEVQAEINTMDQKISQIQAQCGEVLAFQREVTTQQSGIRKCLSVLDLLAGKIQAAAVMSSHTCIPEFLMDILGEVGTVVGGQEGEAFQNDKEIQASILEINKAVNAMRARAGESLPIDP
ncbi:hypothetical protein JRQ81_003461 [Phrynocephalus forsythii]|uniref:Uncharacterized protein n=1 Tax=Phrynocephalus forsythii TaxID=171643 RepID=A0A9Q0XJT4_9SAUR|nr:hypothetical protein JRQ81_003461 [Phrynocephalus forsythii]